MAKRVASPVLIGRERELEELVGAWAAAVEGHPSTVLIGGEAGIGKSRLVGELAQRVRGAGGLVLEGASVSLGGEEALPLAPIADALRALIRQVHGDELEGVIGTAGQALGRLVPELSRPDEGPGQTRPEVSDPPSRPDLPGARLLEAFLGVLHRLADRQPVLLIAEDLHWADASTRDLLAFCTRSAHHERVLLVGTYRTDELHRRHPLRGWLAEMERVQSTDRMLVEPLRPDALARLITEIQGGIADPALVRSIAERSGGNPFYAEEIIAAGAGSGQGALPANLREVVLSRVAAMSDEVGDVLGIAAVAGLDVEHDLLREIAESDDQRLEAAMREAIAAGLIVATDGPKTAVYAFRHALVQEAVYEDLLPTQRRRHHAAFAAALRGKPVPDGAQGAAQLAALGHHSSASHDLSGALAAWIAAGRASARAFAFAAAARDLERALGLWEAVPVDDRPPAVDEVQLIHELSLARWRAGEMTAAFDAARRAVEVADAAGDTIRTAALLERLGQVAWGAGEFEEAMRSHARAVALADHGPPNATLARALSGYGAVLMLRGRFHESIDVCHRAIEVARAVAAELPELNAMNSLAVCLAQLGDCAAAESTMREVFARTPALGDIHEMGRTYGNFAAVLQLCGRLEQSAEVSAQGSDWARRNGVWRIYGAFHDANRASALIDLGRWAEARAALAAASEGDLRGVAWLNHAANAGPLAVRTGDLELGERVLREAADRLQSVGDAQFTAPVAIGLIELALARGQLDDAWSIASDAISGVASTDDATLQASLLATAARVAADRALVAAARHRKADRESAVADARRLADAAAAAVAVIDRASPAARDPLARVALARAEAARAAAELSVGAWASAAAAWDAIGPRWEAAYARFREGEALLGAGDRPAAAARLARARSASRLLGAAPLTTEIEALVQRGRLSLAPSGDPVEPSDVPPDRGPADPFGLTTREREVLALVAAGHTNRRIADTLFISESTAGVHVSNILGKLGVASRTEAATVAVRLGLDRVGLD